ncbi:DUF362 domain-containing protein [uncultured Methanoregula sp.]|uniref:DUF362 domain-containing protein n=1 Tax=uncultured Methanoregula sp. TaxID=1005933 RepID=UPI002AABC629|nr:DUF362 domain-containing protein [uncultured Methanoregula sp.]
MGEHVDIFIADAADRFGGVESVLGGFDLSVLAGSSVAVKANYNSADPFPASTHIETLDALCTIIADQKPEKITLAERSGGGETRDVLARTGVLALARDRGFAVTVLDEMERNGWHEIQAPNLHWSRGFFIAAPFIRSDHVVQTCCLKTHRYGGHFTLSLKNAVGCIAKRVQNLNYDFMNELHTSPHQRSMIAEINKFFRTDLVVLDATEGFASGGPDKGKLINPGVILAGSDRVAIDAVGVALLRSFGTVPDVANGRIFDQEQIARAALLGIGISSTKQIRLQPLDKKAENIAAKIQEQLDKD